MKKSKYSKMIKVLEADIFRPANKAEQQERREASVGALAQKVKSAIKDPKAIDPNLHPIFDLYMPALEDMTAGGPINSASNLIYTVKTAVERYQREFGLTNEEIKHILNEISEYEDIDLIDNKNKSIAWEELGTPSDIVRIILLAFKDDWFK